MNTSLGWETRLRAIWRRCCIPPEEGAGSIVDPPRIDLDPLQPITRPAANRGVAALTYGHQRFTDVAAGGRTETEPVARILVNEAPLGSREPA
jgi:hypothetical protein